MRSEDYGSWVCLCVCVCLLYKSNLISRAFVRAENTVTYSVGNGGQKICGAFFETAPFKCCGNLKCKLSSR